MKLAGEFEFLGNAYKGDVEYDAPPPRGVVKLFYPGQDGTGDAGRCGFFRCPWWRWGAFKDAATRLQPDRRAHGIYPIATIFLLADQADAEVERKQSPG